MKKNVPQAAFRLWDVEIFRPSFQNLRALGLSLLAVLVGGLVLMALDVLFLENLIFALVVMIGVGLASASGLSLREGGRPALLLVMAFIVSVILGALLCFGLLMVTAPVPEVL